MEVLNDFDEASTGYEEEKKMGGILLKGQKRVIEIQDGQEVRFGRDAFCDIVIPLREGDMDETQFVLKNLDGKLYIIDVY